MLCCIACCEGCAWCCGVGGRTCMNVTLKFVYVSVAAWCRGCGKVVLMFVLDLTSSAGVLWGWCSIACRM